MIGVFIVCLDFSDEVRQGFGSLPDFVPKESEGAPEDMFERYKRLKQEVTDLLADMEQLKMVCVYHLISMNTDHCVIGGVYLIPNCDF